MRDVSREARAGRTRRPTSSLPFTRNPDPLLDDGAVRQPLVRVDPDQHAADGGEALETSARVDRVADGRVGDVAVAADLANDDARRC